MLFSTQKTLTQIIVLAIFFIFVIPCTGFALHPVDSVSDVFNQESVYSRSYTMDSNRRIDSITGETLAWYRLHIPALSLDAVESATYFVSTHSLEFGLTKSSDNVTLVCTKTSPGGTHVHLRQTFNDIPLYHSDINVSIDNDNFIRMVVGNTFHDFHIAQTIPAVSNPEATRIARDLLKGEGPELAEPFAELTGFRDRDGNDYLAWNISLVSMDPMGDWEVLVDALTGDILGVEDRMVYVDGTGQCFDPDPLTTAEVNYGATGYVDNNDQDSDQLNAERIVVDLFEITQVGNTYHLEGPHVDLTDFEAPYIAPVTGTTPDDFVYTRSESGFEDVMVYYQIDHSQRYIQSLGFNNIQNNPIQIDPHGLNGDDNSHYIPSMNRIAYGEGGVDDAEDADVILHEYGHSIQISQAAGWSGGHCSDMGEGFADYWAGTHSQRVSDYHSTWVFNWDGHNPFWNGRILNDTGVYPNDWNNGDIYGNGQIWSSCLWLIRGDIGPDAADAIVLQHHFHLGSGVTVEDAAEALMLAEDELFGGEYLEQVANRLYQKGFIDEVPAWGNVTGTVSDSETSEPIEGVEIIIGDLDPVYTDESGTYLVLDIPIGTYPVSVSVNGYLPWEGEVTVVNNQTVTLNINLIRPLLEIAPDEISFTMYIESTFDTSFTIHNGGTGDANWVARFRNEAVDPVLPWSENTSIDILTLTGDNRILGVTECDGYFVVSGANRTSNPNRLYVIDQSGQLIDQVNQPTTSFYGFYDLTSRNGLVYGAEDGWLIGLTLGGEIVDSIEAPLNTVRALVYDPEREWFWCADNRSDVYAIDTTGVEQARYDNDLRITGFGYAPYDPDGYSLIITSADGGESRVLVSKMNPETGETVTVLRLAETSEFAISAGAEITNHVSGMEDYWIAAVLVNTSTNESAMLELYNLATSVQYLEANPKSGILGSEADETVTITFNTSGMMPGVYNGFAGIEETITHSLVEIPYSVNVIDVSTTVESGVITGYDISAAYPNPFNPSTTWTVHVSNNTDMTMKVFNLLGQVVDLQDYNGLVSGINRITWHAPEQLSSGIYFVQFSFGDDAIFSQRILLMR